MAEEWPENGMDILRAILSTSAGLSVLGSLFIIISYFAFKLYKLFHMRIILMLALSDLGTSVTAIASTWLRYYYAADLISNVKVNSLSYFLDPCILSGSVLQLFGLSSVIWSFCVANMIHLVISVHWDRVESMEKWYHLFGWLLPIASVVYVLVTDQIGDSVLYCWIDDNLSQLLLFYAPLLIVFLYNAVVAIAITRSTSSSTVSVPDDRQSYSPERSPYDRRAYARSLHSSTGLYMTEISTPSGIGSTFRWFLVSLFVCWFVGLVNRTYLFIYPDKPLFWLFCVQAALSPLQGACNAFIFGFNDAMRAHLRVCMEKRQSWESGSLSRLISSTNSEGVVDEQSQRDRIWQTYYKQTLSEYDVAAPIEDQ